MKEVYETAHLEIMFLEIGDTILVSDPKDKFQLPPDWEPEP